MNKCRFKSGRLWKAGPSLILVLPFVLLWASASLGQSPSPLLQNISGRRSISLNGDWHYIVDSHDGGVQRRFYLNGKTFGNRDFVEYDFASSPTLRVPGDWNFQRPELQLYEGTVWYQKSFDYHPEPNTRAFLYLGAANYKARIWVNGQPLCEHEGGFTSFDCEATSLLHDGDNFIIISVNNLRHPDDIPSLTPDWFNYGGLTRDVLLAVVPQKFIEQYSVQLDRSSAHRIEGWARVTGASEPQKVRIRIPELKLASEMITGSEGVAHFKLDAQSLQLWSPENPRLYRVELSTDADQISEEVGFRTIETRGTEVLLNGSPVFLRGISVHEDAPNRSGRAHGDDDARTLLSWAKDLGCNFVRLAHYPYDEHMTRMADRLGLLVWSEIPVYQGIDFKNQQVLDKALRQLTEMITRDRNRAAIIFWSVSNETPKSAERTAFLHQLITTARSLDPTRLITAATNQVSTPAPHKKVFDDPIIADLDVYGINEYIAWYEGIPADLDVTNWSAAYNKPMIVSEFGGDAKQGLHGAGNQRWTEEYQEEIYRHQIASLRKIPFLRGMSPWILKDFRSPHRQLPGIQDGYNRKGLISENGERKKAFYILQAYYHELVDHSTK